ncbi:MAG TPA: alpha-E domain-containing protein [Kofleriaceae bacterium]|nr:alpha-E domain-containing protein [Kofleriaceae bacterium]
MISRVADHCFWFGRYVERAEATARMLGASVSLALDGELPSAHVWRPVIVVSGEQEAFRARIAGGDGEAAAWGDGEVVQRFMVWDEDNGVSLARSIAGMRWNARSIREVLSLEAWEAVNELHLWMRSDGANATYLHHRDGYYQHVRRATQLTLGLLRSTMLHDEPLDFVWLGVLLERVNQTARILDVHHHAFTQRPRGGAGDDVVETALWLSLLRALSGGEAYLKRSAGKISSEGVARFLVSEPAFPRSIAYCVHSAYERLCDVRPPDIADLPGGESVARLRALDEWVAARRNAPLAGDAVHELLTHVVDEVHAICGTLGRELFGAPAPA